AIPLPFVSHRHREHQSEQPPPVVTACARLIQNYGPPESPDAVTPSSVRYRSHHRLPEHLPVQLLQCPAPCTLHPAPCTLAWQSLLLSLRTPRSSGRSCIRFSMPLVSVARSVVGSNHGFFAWTRRISPGKRAGGCCFADSCPGSAAGAGPSRNT